MLKKLALAVLVLLIVVGGGLYYLGANLDGIVKGVIVKYGSEATQAQTTLRSVKISLSDGMGELDGLTLGNPKGFDADNAVAVGKIAVKIDTKALMGKGPIVIDEVLVQAPQVTFEVAKDGKNNLQTIQKNIAAYAEKLATPPSAKAEKTADASTEKNKNERKIVIRSLKIDDGLVRLQHQLLKGKKVEAKLPPIHLANIGQESGGATAAQVGQIVLNALMVQAQTVGSETLVKQLRDQGVESLKGAVEQSNIGKSVGGAIKGLFGN